MIRSHSIIIGFAILVVFSASLIASVPTAINYQGKLTDGSGTPVSDDTYSVVFSIYNASSGGALKWTETQNVTTSGGMFSVLLGSTTPILDTVFNQSTSYLGIKVGADAELTPRIMMVSVPYAYRVATVDGASGGNITSDVSIGALHTVTGQNTFVAGYFNTVSGSNSSCSGGSFNEATGDNATVSGGSHNYASGRYSVIAGGGGAGSQDINSATGNYSSIGGGVDNYTLNTRATVSGGAQNIASGYSSTVSGGNTCFARGDFSVVGGGGGFGADSNSAIGANSTISGGVRNYTNASWTVIGGGTDNAVTTNRGTIAGGGENLVSGNGAVIGGGSQDTASAWYSTISGGIKNTASNDYATIGGGYYHLVDGHSATVGGGYTNIASGKYATVPGGIENSATGDFSFAAGRKAKANHRGTFVWADSTNTDFASTGGNQFLIRASGGVGIGTNDPKARLHIKGSGFPTSFGYFDTDAISQDAGLRFLEDGITKSHLFHGSSANTLNLYGAGFSGISIDANGDVGIGTNVPNYKLDVRGSIGSNATLYHSDRRWKKNINTMSNSLDKVQHLRGVSFDWKRDEFTEMNFPEGKQIGLIAQEVEKILPEVVNTGADGYKSVDYSKMVALLVEANKEQQKQIASQQEQINELKELVVKLVAGSTGQSIKQYGQK